MKEKIATGCGYDDGGLESCSYDDEDIKSGSCDSGNLSFMILDLLISYSFRDNNSHWYL